jgi:hypothetical protein
MSLQRSDNEYLRAFNASWQSDQLSVKVLPAPLVPRSTILAFFVNPAIEDIHDDQLLLC